MATENVSLTIRGAFGPGKTVRLHARTRDFFEQDALGKAVKTAKADKQNDVTFSGLPPYTPYWAVGEAADGSTVHRAVYTKRPNERPPAPAAPARGQAEAPGLPLRAGEDYIQGPRNTKNVKPVEANPSPAPSQEHFPKGRPQRSDTPLGEATPVDPKEFQPKVPRSEMAKNTPQRDGAEVGEAQPVDKDEVQPAAKYQDVPKRTPQRVGAEVGTAEPIPQTGSQARGAERKAKDSSAQKARGATPAKPEAKRKPKGAVKQTTRKGTPKRKAPKKRTPKRSGRKR